MYLIKNIFPRRAPRDFVLSLQFFSLFSNGAASRFLWLASYGQTEGCVKLFGKYALCALISSTHSRRCRHCSYQTTKKSTERILPNHHKHVYIRSRLCLCLGTYMFTLDTDSLKTLGFNPRTPTLRLRPMTSRLLKYRRCSLLLRPLCISDRADDADSRFLARFKDRTYIIARRLVYLGVIS